ncbi:MAG: TusE/DsrC/DsvC family sulfur relay protein [Candidatus Paceibacterota bacterium]|jgi:tRNA 2-thiouridine synthesizing protein E
MPTIDFQGRQIEVDDDGYLLNLDDWSKELAEVLAKQDNTELTPEHWEVINLLRDHYKQYQIVPFFNNLIRVIGRVLGPEKGNSKHLFKLYPGSPVKRSCKYAGLPKPTGCI